MFNIRLYIFILFIFASNSLFSIPSKATLKKYEIELNQQIKINFNDATLDKILNYLRSKSKTPIYIDRDSLEEEIFEELDLNLKKTSLKNALLWLTELSVLDFDIDKHGIKISTKDEIIRPYIKIAIYDFRSLTHEKNESKGPYLGNPYSYKDYEVFQGRYGEDEKKIKVEDILERIKKEILPESWDLKSVRVQGEDNLIQIHHTKEAHNLIKNFLKKNQLSHRRQVAFQLQILQTPSKNIDLFLEKYKNRYKLTKEETKELLLTEFPKWENTKSLGTSKIVSINDTNSYISMIRNKKAIVDFDVVEGDFDPIVGDVLKGGFYFMVRPVISYDLRKVNLYFDSSFYNEIASHNKAEILREARSGKTVLEVDGSTSSKGEVEIDNKKNKTSKQKIKVSGTSSVDGEFVRSPNKPKQFGTFLRAQANGSRFSSDLILEDGGSFVWVSRINPKTTYFYLLQTTVIP